MSAIAGNLSAARLKTIGLWGLKLVLAALFLFFGGAKLIGHTAMVEVFDHVGLGQWFRYMTGSLEVGGAALLLWPATTALGALILMTVSIGAAFAQLFVLHEDGPSPGSTATSFSRRDPRRKAGSRSEAAWSCRLAPRRT